MLRAADLSQQHIADRIRGSACGAPPVFDSHLRPASVLMPVLWKDNTWHLLYTRRTETVHNHKGQVSFPGGASEPSDASAQETALREAWEEIGLLATDVTILGCLEPMPTLSQYLITPVVGRMPWPYEFVLSPGEVSRVFTLPLDWLAEPAHWEIKPRTVPPGVVEDVIFYEVHDEELLWGISARLTQLLLTALGLL